MGNCTQKEDVVTAETVEPAQEAPTPAQEDDLPPVAEPEPSKQPEGVTEDAVTAETVEPAQEAPTPAQEDDLPLVVESEPAKQPEGVTVVFKVGKEEKELVFMKKPLGMTHKVAKGCCGRSVPSRVVISKMKPKGYAEALGIKIGWQVVKLAGEAIPEKMTQDEFTAALNAAMENLPTVEDPVTAPGTATAPAVDTTADKSEAATDKAAKPAVDKAAEPAAEKATEPAADNVAEPAADTAAEPAADKAAEPAADEATEPAADQAVEPAADKAAEPVADKAAESAAEKVAEPEK